MSETDIPADIFFIDHQSDQTLQDQIRQAIVSAILTRQLPVGARLPSSRRLAKHLGVSRITISLAYQELVSQDYLTPLQRSGYLVSEQAPIPRLGEEASSKIASRLNWQQRLGPSLMHRRQITKPLDWRSLPYPFIYGQMDESLFDHGAWRDCVRRALGQREFNRLAGDAMLEDDPMLIDYILTRSLPRRGIHASKDQVLVTVGAQNALWLSIQLLGGAGRRAVCEHPGYPDIVSALRWHQTDTYLVDVDEQGLPPEHLPEQLDFVCVTPSHHAPTAVTMPIDRRNELLRLAETRDFIIIEDDYDFEMSFLSAPSPALKSLDKQGRVVYIGSFSKALFPGLRLGYLVGDPEFIREARQLRALILRHPPGHMQRSAAYFLALGHYDRQIRTMRDTYAHRRKILMDYLEKSCLKIAGAPRFGGTNLWMEGPAGVMSGQLAAAALAQGVLIEPGTPFFDDQADVPYFRLGYSTIATDNIQEGIARLSETAIALQTQL